MRGQPGISPIYRLAQPAVADPDAAFARTWALCRRLWQQQGTITVRPKQLPPVLREQMTEWANREYGERAR